MSRTLYEWLAARDAWRQEHNQRAASFPYPQKESVVYNWSSPNDFWEDRRNNAADLISASRILFDENRSELKALGERVHSVGIAELEKERTFLRQILPDFNFDDIEGKELIDQLNEVMHGQVQYKNALGRIKAALKPQNQSKGQLAPSASSLFSSYLGTEISRIFSNFIRRTTVQDPFTEWTGYFESHLNNAIDRAVQSMLEEIGTKGNINEIYGDASQWKELGKAYKEIEGFSQQFQQMIRNKINFQGIINMFEDEAARSIYEKAKSGKRNSGFRKYIDKSAHLKSQAGQIGGSVAEYINDLMEKIAPKSGTITDRGSTVIIPEITLADRVTVYQFSADIEFDAQTIANEISNSLIDSVSLKDSAQRLEEFYERNLRNLEHTVIIYGSDKEYQLNMNFNGFHNGGQMPLERLPDYISDAGINANIGMDFVYTAYNTLPSAIYANMRGEIETEITNILTAAAAKLLFNDWSTIGESDGGTSALHVLNLDGIIVPSSYVLINLGQAMMNAADDMHKWFKVDLNLPQTIEYREGDWKTFQGTDLQVKQQIYDKWQKQFETARKESYFSTSFLSNFKDLMRSLI